MSTNSARVIIVGGGPVGLTAAHALARANIDFILLESRQKIVLDAGSNLVLTPIGLRTLSQLGLLPALNKVTTPLVKFKRFDHSGRNIGDLMFCTYAKESHGIFPKVVSRHDLMQVLWDGLSPTEQSNVYANKKVDEISTTTDGVIVRCTDGTAYQGSMVIGADGAHSAVRRQMRRLALQELQKQSDLEAECPSVGLNEEKPFLTTYRCLWVRFPSHGGVVAGDAMETHGTGATVQLFAGERTAVVGVYERLSEPTIESQRYSPEDEDAMVKRWSKIPLNGNGLTLGDVYAERLQSGLVSLEEGVLDHWSWAGRIVLVGDAAHKFTPSTGAGCNNGLVDVAVLANLLNEEYNTAGESQNEPSAEGLSVAFTKYQHSRQESVRAACKNSSIATATATWKSTLHWFLDTWILPSLMVQKYLAGKQAIVTSKTPGFDYIESDKELTGNVPWVHSVA